MKKNRPSSTITPVQMVTVSSVNAGQRLDNFLLGKLKAVPKSRIYRMIRSGEVRLNKKRAKAHTRINTDDVVRIPPVIMPERGILPQSSARSQQTLKDAILYEDKYFLVVNKPSGMAVHGGSGISLGVIEILRQMFPKTAYLELVHRLDKDTSGCLLVAKKPSILKALHKDLREGAINKRYAALCMGRWQAQHEAVKAPLLKNTLASGERMVMVSKQGKAALTVFTAEKSFKNMTLMLASPHTGRTHQIRVHALAAGHPIAGDVKYGDKESNQQLKKIGLTRLFLHALSLKFNHPGTQQSFKVLAPLPKDLQQVLAALV